MTSYTVTVDRSTCAGIGLCEMAAADMFQVGEDGSAAARVDAIEEVDHAKVEEAAHSCPTRSIRILPR